MNVGGLSKRIIALALVGHIRGGLGYVAILAAVLLSALPGSAVADAAALTALLLPMMVAAGHDKARCGALIAASGVRGQVIPPSIVAARLRAADDRLLRAAGRTRLRSLGYRFCCRGRGHPAAQLSRVEQAQRIEAALDAHHGRIQVVLLAVFHDVHVGVVDLHAVVAVDLHDLVQAFFRGVADDLQAAAVERAFLGAQELQVHHHLTLQRGFQGLGLLELAHGVEPALDVGEPLVHLQRMERGVVPGVFDERLAAFFHLVRGLAVGDLATVPGDHVAHARL
ncbi:TRAP transporter large permease subunit [Variovorax sp. MHTC-1]|nr:TRAP transporter large permease subunit [Variovorax sp. MHTC-1]